MTWPHLSWIIMTEVHKRYINSTSRDTNLRNRNNILKYSGWGGSKGKGWGFCMAELLVHTYEQFSRKVKQSWKWKILTPLHFLCGGRLPGGINKNNHILIGRCIVAMVTALDHVGQTSMFWPKNSLSRSKNKRVWFSGAREPIQMKFIQMVEPLSQFIKIAVKRF